MHEERRLQFLDRLGTAVLPLTSADELLAVTTRLVGEFLGVSCCAYADMDDDEDGFTIRGDWSAPGSPSIVGHYRLADFGELAVRNLSAGRPLVVNNNLEELAAHEAKTFQDLGITATICMPLVKDGRLTALMAIHDKASRTWTEDELSLIQEVTSRSWAHVARVGAEAELRAGSERFSAAVSAVNGVLWTNDAEGRMIGEQPGWAAITGQSRAEYEGFGWSSAVHPDDAQATLVAWNEAVAERKPFIFEHRLRRHDGEWRHFSIRAIPVLTDEGRVREWVGVHTDITEQRVAEGRLRELNASLERRVAEALTERKVFADIVEGTDAFVQVVDLEFRWLAINQAAAAEFERIFGKRPRVGVSMLDLLADQPEHQAAVREVWSRALRGEEFTEISEFGDPGRDRRFYEMKYNVLWDDDGRQVGAFQFVYDVTHRLREQARLVQAEEQLRQSQKMEAMGQLTGGVAHDFNNLLTPIIGSLDMLQRRGVGTEREQRLIGGALQSADRARTLVQRLLAFARRQPLQPTAVDVAAIVMGMSDLVASTTGPQVRVVVEVADNLARAKADTNQLEMALLNLSVNARDAMPGGGTIRITAENAALRLGERQGLSPGDYVKISVADTGRGMDAATLSRAVEPFFSTKGIGKGTGLGLSMVHGLMQQLGGSMTLSSQPGLGTNVELWLPQSINSVAAAPLDGATGAAAAPPADSGLALLVDDEELVRLSTAALLGDLGYSVAEANSAEDALKLIAGGLRPSLLITDHLMPGMNGTDLARTLMAQLDVPVLIISGYADAEGVDPDLPRLTKPFTMREFKAALAAR